MGITYTEKGGVIYNLHSMGITYTEKGGVYNLHSMGITYREGRISPQYGDYIHREGRNI